MKNIGSQLYFVVLIVIAFVVVFSFVFKSCFAKELPAAFQQLVKEQPIHLGCIRTVGQLFGGEQGFSLSKEKDLFREDDFSKMIPCSFCRITMIITKEIA